MIELLFALIIVPLAFAGLALGVLAGRRGIRGSCGGLGRIPGIDSDCRGACHPGNGSWTALGVRPAGCPARRNEAE